ncbi:hypothetical protein, partial [Succinimonas sp.]|uniref:hypothetical protein n=1 Tax=Succinimonas sp. TaxID=1936151 RepID=UPI0038669A3C
MEFFLNAPLLRSVFFLTDSFAAGICPRIDVPALYATGKGTWPNRREVIDGSAGCLWRLRFTGCNSREAVPLLKPQR